MNKLSPTAFDRVREMAFARGLDRIPPEVAHFAALLLLDTLGVAAAATGMEAAKIARETALDLYAARAGGPAAKMLFDGRAASVAGAAFAAAAQIDNLDAHDGYNPTKGHIGVAVVPALLTFAQGLPPISGREALAALIAGYEIGARAGIALHATVTDYHTSGAWNALGVAAIGARLRKNTPAQLREALGIAEYHGPRSQMMRVIDVPTMLHDGSAWGALAGATAVFMAERGFTGAPAITVEAAEVADIWRDLGEAWVVDRHYIKPYPVCRWIHSLVGAAVELRAKHGIKPAEIARIDLTAFHEATRLYREVPETTAVAQYAISFPVAAALVRGRVGVDEIGGDGLSDPEVARLVALTEVHESDEYNKRFPAGRWGDVAVSLKDGRRLQSGPRDARGGPENPLKEEEMVGKFFDFAGPALGAARARRLADAVLRLEEADSSFAPVIELCCQAG
jgi:2-methylcitrate dehydratase PrpD